VHITTGVLENSSARIPYFFLNPSYRGGNATPPAETGRPEDAVDVVFIDQVSRMLLPFPKSKVTREGYAAAFPGPEQMPFDRIREVAALRSAVVFDAQLGIKLGILQVNQQQQVKVNILRTYIENVRANLLDKKFLLWTETDATEGFCVVHVLLDKDDIESQVIGWTNNMMEPSSNTLREAFRLYEDAEEREQLYMLALGPKAGISADALRVFFPTIQDDYVVIFSDLTQAEMASCLLGMLEALCAKTTRRSYAFLETRRRGSGQELTTRTYIDEATNDEQTRRFNRIFKSWKDGEKRAVLLPRIQACGKAVWPIKLSPGQPEKVYFRVSTNAKLVVDGLNRR
jgi:hypothetical protein